MRDAGFVQVGYYWCLTEIELEPRSPASPPKEPAPDGISQYALASVVGFALALTASLVAATQCRSRRSEEPANVAPNAAPNDATEDPEVEEKKCDMVDDNASTVTPDSCASGKMDDDLALDDSTNRMVMNL